MARRKNNSQPQLLIFNELWLNKQSE